MKTLGERLAIASLATLAALTLAACGKSEVPKTALAPAGGRAATTPAPVPTTAPAPERSAAPAPTASVAPVPEARAAISAPAVPPVPPGELIDAPEPTEIVLWHGYRGLERAALDKLIGQFNGARQNLRIRALPVPFDALVDKLEVTIPYGRGPDVFIFAHNMIGQWLESGEKPLIESITAWAPRELLRSYFPEAVRPLVYRKALYGLPLAYKSLVLYYNPELVPTPPKTTDELIAMAKAVTDSAQKRYGLVYDASKLYFHAPWIHAFGGTILDDDDAPHLDTPEQVAAARFVRSLVKERRVLPEGMTEFMVASLFNDGKAAMVFSGPWFRADVNEGVRYAVAPLPTLSANGQPLKPLLGIEAIMLNAFSDKKRWAFEVMRFLASDEAALLRCVEGKQPVPNVAVYDDERVAADPHIPVFLAQAKQSIPMNASRQMQVVWSTMDNALARAIFAANGDPAAALAEAQAKVTEDIRRQQP